MVLQVARGRSKFQFRLPGFVKTGAAEGGVGRLVVLCEIEIVLNERSAGESVVTHAITAYPGVEEREREKKEKKKYSLGFARAARRQYAEVLLIQRGTRRKLLLSSVASLPGSILMRRRCPKAEEGTR